MSSRSQGQRWMKMILNLISLSLIIPSMVMTGVGDTEKINRDIPPSELSEIAHASLEDLEGKNIGA